MVGLSFDFFSGSKTPAEVQYNKFLLSISHLWSEQIILYIAFSLPVQSIIDQLEKTPELYERNLTTMTEDVAEAGLFYQRE